jgi:nucleolar protein 58
MWGIQHQMRKLVPQEKSELTKEDRLPMSQGLKKFLSHNGFDVKPEMVSSLVELAMPSAAPCHLVLHYTISYVVCT